MSEETIVPFANAAAKRANEIERAKGAPASQDNGDLNMDAITNILRVLEGMQGQIEAMTEVIVQLDKRISVLEKPKTSRIIHG
jgi:hypothetical protein